MKEEDEKKNKGEHMESVHLAFDANYGKSMHFIHKLMMDFLGDTEIEMVTSMP